MQRHVTVPILVALGLLVLTLGACGPDEELLAAEARVEAWAHLQEAHRVLTEKRDELTARLAQIEAGADALEIAEDQDRGEAFVALESAAATIEEEIGDEADSFMSELVGFINENPMTQGEEPTKEQLAAIRMKSGEDLLLALEYVNRGGDWKRAADIIERQLKIDADNEELKEKLAWVKEMRFVNKERFAKVERGMTQEQVTEVLGPVNIRNIKEFPGNQVGWFYRKDPDLEGGAAGIYFQEKGGVWKVYRLGYDEIKPAG